MSNQVLLLRTTCTHLIITRTSHPYKYTPHHHLCTPHTRHHHSDVITICTASYPNHQQVDKHTTLWLPDDLGSIRRLTHHKLVKGGEVEHLHLGVEEDKIFLPIIGRGALHCRITVCVCAYVCVSGLYLHMCMCVYVYVC